MNGKTKALLREEFQVAVPIAGGCILNGALGMLSIRFLTSGTDASGIWQDNDTLILAVALAASLLLISLLVLNVGNSGHLRGGFSRRILHLPVETYKAVACVLFARICTLWCTTASLSIVCHLLFGHGPGLHSVGILTSFYLLVQMADWARSVAPVPVLGAAAGGMYLLWNWAGGLKPMLASLIADERVTAAAWGFFACELLAAYGVGLFFVSLGRRGVRISPGMVSLPRALPRPERKKPFSSPAAAQRWFERHDAKYSLSMMLLYAWCLLAVLRWLLIGQFRMLGEPRSPFWEPYWLFEVFPFIALVFAAFMWNVRTRVRRKQRPGFLVTRLPSGGEQAAKDQLIAGLFELVPAFLAVTGVSITSYLMADQRLALDTVREAYRCGELGIQEITGILLGWSLSLGMLAWLIMHWKLPPRSWRLLLGMSVAAFPAAHLIILWGDEASLEEFFARFWETAILMLPLLLSGFTLGHLCNGWYKGVFSGRCLFRILLFWCVASVVLFPHLLASAWDVRARFIALLTSVALGAILILPYLMSAWRFRAGTSLTVRQRQRLSEGFGLRKIAGYVAIAAVLAALLWLRWPQTPTWVKTWRSQGLPTNLEELKACYPPVPPSENLAELYLGAGRTLFRIRKSLSETRDGSPNRHYSVSFPMEGPKDGQLWQSAEAWREMKCYRDDSSPVLLTLHAAARSGLTKSHYPVSLDLGAGTDESVPDWPWPAVRLLALDAVLAANEGKSEAATQSILDLFPMADSLRAILLGRVQFARHLVHSAAINTLEWVMNLTVLTDKDLERLRDSLYRSMEPVEEARIVDSTIRAEEVLQLTGRSGCGLQFDYEKRRVFSSAAALAPLLDLASSGRLFQFIIHCRLESVRKNARDVALHKTVLEPQPYSAFKQSGRIQVPWPFYEVSSCFMDYFYCYRTRSAIAAAWTAIAVEQFRRANGVLPQHLVELCPEYLDKVPVDVFCGNPMHLRVREDGGFSVYSCDADGHDDGGREGKGGQSGNSCDLTFSVPSPEALGCGPGLP